MRRDEQAITAVVGALLVLGGLAVFLAIYNLKWAPVQVANREGDTSLEFRQSLADWADTGEGLVARGLANVTFSRTLTVGAPGAAGQPGSGGTLSLASGTSAPVLTVYRATTQVAQVGGSLTGELRFHRFPQQTVEYALGGLEVTQATDSWVDVRSVLTVQRASLGKLSLTVQALGLSGGPQSQGGTRDVQVLGTVTAASSSTQAASNVRLHFDRVAGNAWKAALERHLGAQDLTGSTAADCTSAATNYCFDTDTTDTDTADLWLLDVETNWTLITGTVHAELRS